MRALGVRASCGVCARSGVPVRRRRAERDVAHLGDVARADHLLVAAPVARLRRLSQAVLRVPPDGELAP